MREYEVTIILQPQLDEEAREALIQRVGELLAPEAEEDAKPVVNHWGTRQLAYPIHKFTEGYYVLYETKIAPERVREIERNMQYTEDILRYLVVRKEE
ncbi:MAG: 30S ribosomal protein S6 [Anaerolineae bacterium]